MALPKILRVVWGDQEGHVFLTTKKPGDKKSWSEHPFYWPDDKAKIARFIERNYEDLDLYWAPMVFSDSQRTSGNSTPCSYLWADLDPVSPHKCVPKPSIAWESSPGRYQAIWFLEEEITPSDHDELNKRLTYSVGADKSGWDLTQVLRLPGTINHKYVEKPPVKLMWLKRNTYEPQELADQLPPVGINNLIDVDELDIEFNDLREVVWPYRKVLGDKLWELLFTPNSEISEGERSDRLWELEARLIERGIPVTEVLQIAKACPWNKYKGRNDENKRLLVEILKVEKKVRNSPIVTATEDKMPWATYSNMMGKNMVGPGWLIEGIWANNSHGMIAGEPKTYKSIISTEIAVSVASGRPMWDTYKVHRSGKVLIIQEENAPWVVKDRFTKVSNGKDLLRGQVKHIDPRKGIYHVKWPEDLPIKILNNWGFDLTQQEHRLMLEEEIDKTRPVLVILDPLYLMLGKLDDNSAQELRETLAWFLQLKNEYRFSLIILHHWNKGGASARGGQRMLGSTTFHAWVESAMYTSIRDPETNEITIEREFRSFVKPDILTMKINMSDPGEEPVYEASIRKLSEVKNTKATKEDLLRYLMNNGMASTNEITAFSGYSDEGAKKTLNKFIKEGLVFMKPGKKGRGLGNKYGVTPEGKRFIQDKEGEQSE